jgi:tyrosyl-tRNA synthetase
MYGKLMSISDTLMWSYWTLLTDLRQSEIAQMQAEVSSGSLHPMEAKKSLAQTITADFHGKEFASQAAANWSKQFQQREAPEDLEEVQVSCADLVNPSAIPAAGGAQAFQIRVSKLLVKVGLAASGAEASRKLSENAVRINGQVVSNANWQLDSLPVRLIVRVGKRAKAVTAS